MCAKCCSKLQCYRLQNVHFKKIKLEFKPNSETLVKGFLIIMCVGDTCCDRST